MIIEPHDLHHEFPQFHQVIEVLRTRDGEFQRRFEEYNELDRHVRQIEENDEPITDFELEDMKKRRVHLKDDLYARLRAFKAG